MSKEGNHNKRGDFDASNTSKECVEDTKANQVEDCMSWKNRMAEIAIGDKVCYSRTFLQSTGQQTGDVPFARGIVTAIEPLGETKLAVIAWDKPDIPERVNVANLSRVTKKGISELP